MRDDRPSSASEMLDSFVEATTDAFSDEGLDGYLPTICPFDSEEDFLIIEGIPEDVPDTHAIQQMIEKHGAIGGRYCFGVQTGCGELTLGAITPTEQHFAVLRETDGVATADRCEKPGWWRLSPLM